MLFDAFTACLAIAAMTATGVVVTVAESKGRARLAGHVASVNNACKIVLYGFAGSRLLAHGPAGWLALLPVLAVADVTTRLATRWAHRHTPPEAP